MSNGSIYTQKNKIITKHKRARNQPPATDFQDIRGKYNISKCKLGKCNQVLPISYNNESENA